MNISGELAELYTRACADVRRALPELALDDATLVAAFARHAPDARTLADCQLRELALAASAASGDTAAIAEIERVAGATIDAVCRRFVHPGHTIDDLKQTLREKLFVGGSSTAKIAQYNGQGSLEAWIRVVATRTFIDLTRRRDRVREILSEELVTPVSPVDLGLEAVKAEYRDAVARALRAAALDLDRGDRHLLRQHIANGLTIDQIAATLSIHRATAARRIAKARERLVANVRERVATSLALDDRELATVLGLVISKLELSMTRLLETRP